MQTDQDLKQIYFRHIVLSKQQIKYFRSLQQKKYRDSTNTFIIEGEKIVIEALQQIHSSIKSIIYTPKTASLVAKFNSSHPNITMLEGSQDDFARISPQKSPQQIMAEISQDFSDTFDNMAGSEIILALERIQDPGNLGTIIRLADWFGITEIICSNDTVDCYSPKVVQATMGALFRCRIKYVDLKETLTRHRDKAGYSVYGSSLAGENLYSADLQKPCIIVLGNEGSGMSEELLSITTKNLLIPNYSKSEHTSESLNVATAAAVLCAELRRR